MKLNRSVLIFLAPLRSLRWMLFFLLASCSLPRACFPNFAQLKTQYPHVIYESKTKKFHIEIKKDPPPNWTSIAKISADAQHAILVSEDWAFYQHEGFDANQIRDAIEKSMEEGKLKRGASTITQQVVRNVYLTQERSLTRKARELWMATKIEKALGKKKILEVYLNIAEWGQGIFGIGQASRFYFQKSPSELSAKEGAFLAMLLPSPKKYSVSFRQKKLTAFARQVMRSVMKKMVQAKFLTEAERLEQWPKPLSFEEVPDPVDDTEEPPLLEETEDLPEEE